MIKKQLIAIAATACALATCQVANASLSILSLVGGAPSGVNKVNFDDLLLGGGGGTATGPNGSVTVSFSPDAAVVSIPNGPTYAAPVLSGLNGVGFGSPDQPNGQDATKYITTGSTGAFAGSKATLQFAPGQMYLGLLWGSVDLYNTLSFFNGATPVGTLTGVDVTAFANGDQGAIGTFYVNINSTLAFDRVEATSSQYAFEFDNVAYSTAAVPEASTMIAGALLLLPLGASALRIVRKNRTA